MSNTGTQMEQVATSWLLHRLTDSPAWLELSGLMRFAPILALTLVGGAMAALLLSVVAVGARVSRLRAFASRSSA